MFVCLISDQTITSVDTWVICLLAKSSLDSITSPHSATSNNFVSCVDIAVILLVFIKLEMTEIKTMLWWIYQVKWATDWSNLESSLHKIPKPILQERVYAILCVLYRNKFTLTKGVGSTLATRLSVINANPLNYRKVPHLQLLCFLKNNFFFQIQSSDTDTRLLKFWSGWDSLWPYRDSFLL